ncbi:MAG: hypothetical protein CMD43_04175 [Gammaproteobacteria bacterium]|nr:hypothetical protein [Gammaproteobacteria bacterium]|tara:strand:- start:4748 stop:5434 length:687 start_codon:yes stop_codon:yes gene_type:complete
MKKFFIILIILNSCSYPEMIRNELIYSNDFEDEKLEKIDGGGLSKFNNTNVIGNFNNDGFTLFLDDIGDHDYVFVSFDLYIHGSWDGNFNGFPENDKPDKWIIEFKPDMDLFKDPSSEKFVTTFSNSPCWSNYCLRQSYPNNYPYENNPKTGSFKVDLERVCLNNFFGGNTTLYQIEKGFKSSGDNIVIRFYDELYQPNAIDKNGIPQQKCDESWSLDNLSIRVIKYQ